MKFLVRSITICLASALVTLGLAGTAHSEEVVPSSAPDSTVEPRGEEPAVTPEQYQALVRDLKSAGAETTSRGTIVVDVPGHGEMELSSGEEAAPGKGDTPQIGGGGGVFNPYVSFNQTDQKALIAGSSAALAGAICLIPAVGQVACVAAVALVAVATVYVNERGLCPKSAPELRVYVYSRTGKCV